MELDLNKLIRIARRRAWLVLLIATVTGAAAYASSSREVPVYSASAIMLVNPGQSISADVDSLQAGQDLARTYRLLITTAPVLDRVASILGLPIVPGEVSAAILETSQLIEVTVTDTDAERAAKTANAVVTEFQLYVAEQASARGETTSTGLQLEISNLEERLAGLDAKIAQLTSAQNAEDPIIQRQVSDLSVERENLYRQITDLSSLVVQVNTEVVAASAQVELTHPAPVPDAPFAPTPRSSAMLGAFVGLMLGVGVVALIEYLDNTVKPEQDLQKLTGAPVLATVASVPRMVPGRAQIFTSAQPRSSAAEAIRLLRTNLEFAAASGPIHSITVTSPGEGEGKSTITANLGVALTQSGVNTIIIDADLRNPTQHRIFGLQNQIGLTTLLLHKDYDWRSVAQTISPGGLVVIPSGPLPPNPSDIVGSEHFQTVIDRIKQDVNLILVDSPPILIASDSLAIAAHTDGLVMVCQSRETRMDALRQATSSVRQGGIRLLGLVLNREQTADRVSYGSQPYSQSVSQTE